MALPRGYSSPVEVPWDFHGSPMVLPNGFISHGTAMGFPWDCHGWSHGLYIGLRYPRYFPWDSRGTTIGTAWKWVHWNPHGASDAKTHTNSNNGQSGTVHHPRRASLAWVAIC